MKIDTERHRNGAEVAERLRQGKGGGLPWTVITDSGGAPLITSDGPDGNIGCPVSASETAYFVQMIRKTARELDEAQIGEIAEALERYAAK